MHPAGTMKLQAALDCIAPRAAYATWEHEGVRGFWMVRDLGSDGLICEFYVRGEDSPRITTHPDEDGRLWIGEGYREADAVWSPASWFYPAAYDMRGMFIYAPDIHVARWLHEMYQPGYRCARCADHTSGLCEDCQRKELER